MEVLSNGGIAAPMATRTLFKISEFVSLPEFGYLSASGLRHLIFNSAARYSAGGEVVPGNGLAESGAIVRIGRRILIDAAKFREWTMKQRIGQV